MRSILVTIASQFIAWMPILMLSGNAGAADDSGCELTFARGLDYEGGSPVPILPTTRTATDIHVVRGERESLYLIARVAGNDAADFTVVESDTLTTDAFRLLPVPGGDAYPVFDVMVPVGAANTTTAWPEHLQYYLVDVAIPGDAGAGIHVVNIELAGCSASARFHVHDLSLPKNDRYIIQAAVDPHAASAHIAETALLHGVNAFAGLFPTLSEQVAPGELQAFLRDPRVRFFRLPVSQYYRGGTYTERFGDPDDTLSVKDRLLDELHAYQVLLDDETLRHKLIIKLWDEPAPPNYAEVAALYSTARTMLPGTLLEIAEQPEPALDNAADIWTVHIDYLRDDDVARQHAAGNSMLVYANKLHAIQNPSDAMRRIGWIIWSHKLDGYHFWRLNWWLRDPYTTRSSWRNDFDKTGTLVYPAPDNEIYSSARLIAFREGMEDAYLLELAEQKCGRDALSWLDSVRPLGIPDSETTDTRSLYPARIELLTRLDTC